MKSPSSKIGEVFGRLFFIKCQADPLRRTGRRDSVNSMGIFNIVLLRPFPLTNLKSGLI